MLFCFMACKKILATFCYLSEYPTCPKAMSWCCIWRTVKLTCPIEPPFHYGSTPGAGFGFLGIELVDLREFGRLVRTKVLVRAVLSQNSVWVFQALSIAQYFCTMVAKSAKCTMSRRLIALRIPLFVQFLQKSETASSSRQSLTLFSTRRNLAQ